MWHILLPVKVTFLQYDVATQCYQAEKVKLNKAERKAFMRFDKWKTKKYRTVKAWLDRYKGVSLEKKYKSYHKEAIRKNKHWVMSPHAYN